MQPNQQPNGTGVNFNPQTGMVVCEQCRAPMPTEMRFCRACGHRLGEGPAEYTETVRFDEGVKGRFTDATNSRPTTPFTPGYNAPIMQPQGHSFSVPCRRRISGMNWIWIALVLFFATGGGLSALVKRHIKAPASFSSSAPRSYFGVDGLKSTDGGATFADVEPPGSPADLAGLLGGDVITSVDGHQIGSADDLTNVLEDTPVGKTVAVEFVRDGQPQKTQLTTISNGQRVDLQRAFDHRPEGQGKLGFNPGDASRITIPEMNLRGVKLAKVDPSGPAALAGLQSNDTIVTFGETPIRTVAELEARIRRVIPYTTVPVVVIRDGKPVTIPVKLGKR